MRKAGICQLGLILAASLALAACGGGGGSSTTATNPTTTPTSGTTTSVAVNPNAAAAATIPNTSTTLNFPNGTVSQAATVSVTQLTASTLPQSINAGSSQGGQSGSTFTPNAGNVFVLGFTITASGITTFNVPLTLSGSVPSTVAAGTTLNLALLQGGSWTIVATGTVGANGSFSQNLASALLPGMLTPGTYVLYQPAAGTSTAVSNLGVALIADDGNGGTAGNGLQVVNLFDASGAPLATPTIKQLPYKGAYDIDGQALTPDGSQGIVVDGGNTVRFFSNVQTGLPVASTTTLDITAYGGDGDSVAIMPNGNEAVVSGNAPNVLLLVSGIVSGKPQAAATIAIPSARDGLVISNDGQVMLARGLTGLTVFNIASIPVATGALGGSVSHSFTQVADFAALGSWHEDGRNGIAISPVDSSRAVIIGDKTALPNISLVTGLNTATPKVQPSLSLTGAGSVWSVAISADGKNAIVGTDAGLALVTGVDTGKLVQVGSLFAPSFTSNGTAYKLGMVPTLGITLDGKYVVVTTPLPAYNNGTLLTIPFTATGFSNPVGQLSGIAVPMNDQMVLH